MIKVPINILSQSPANHHDMIIVWNQGDLLWDSEIEKKIHFRLIIAKNYKADLVVETI